MSGALENETAQVTGEINMEQILINLITGALGGVATGKSSPTFDLGTVGNIISGLVGGGVLGQIVTLALPSVVAAGGADRGSAHGSDSFFSFSGRLFIVDW